MYIYIFYISSYMPQSFLVALPDYRSHEPPLPPHIIDVMRHRHSACT